MATIGEGEHFGDIELLQRDLLTRDEDHYCHSGDGNWENSAIVTSSALSYFYIPSAQIVKHFPIGEWGLLI